MRTLLSRRRSGLPERFWELANYNGRKGQGVVHTSEYEQRMARLQADYDRWIQRQRPGGIYRRDGR